MADQMAEIRNYTLNFGSGRRAVGRRGLTWQAKLASAEIELASMALFKVRAAQD
jgi:hypothetical protein